MSTPRRGLVAVATATTTEATATAAITTATATAATATATATEVAIAAAAAAAEAATTTTTAATTAIFTRTGFVDGQRTTLELLPVEAGNRLLAVIVRRHLDEAEALCSCR